LKLQALLRREIPDGDPGVIFDRAVTLLLAQVENKKLGITAKPRPDRRIRRKTMRSTSARRRRPRGGCRDA